MATKTVPFTFGAVTVKSRKMKTYDVLYTRSRSSSVSGITIRAYSLPNLRKNIINNQKMFDWTYGIIEIYKGGTEIDRKTGRFIGSGNGNINLIGRMRKINGVIQWTYDPYGFNRYDPKIHEVNPKTGELKG